MGNEKLKLIYIHTLGTNVEGKYEYAFYFVKQHLTLCNEDWKETTAGLFNEIFCGMRRKNPVTGRAPAVCASFTSAKGKYGQKMAWEDGKRSLQTERKVL